MSEDTEAEEADDSDTEIDEKSQSMKTEAVEILFDKLWPKGSARPTSPMIVSNEDVIEAIRARNKRHSGEKKPLSTKNPANFLKDFIRKRTCNANWPARLKNLRMTAIQRYGDGQVMEFVPFPDDDDVPFPDHFDPIPDMRVLPFEALSIPVEARVLGRKDEAWLIQVVVSQKLLHTHFAIVAKDKGLNVESVAHLQMSVKTQPEIDATFVANIVVPDGNQERKVRTYVTCEAKQINERILEFQIREQVKKAFELTSPLEGDEAIDTIIPTVFQVVEYSVARGDLRPEKVRGIYVVQFEMFDRPTFMRLYYESLHTMPLRIQSQAFYEPWPRIQGISAPPRKTNRTARRVKTR